LKANPGLTQNEVRLYDEEFLVFAWCRSDDLVPEGQAILIKGVGK